MPAVLFVVLGSAMVLVALWDIFQTLFHPASHGALSDFVSAGIWRTARLTRRKSLLMIAGPVAVVTVIAVWVWLIILGFALIYWPSFVPQVTFAPGIDPAQHHSFMDALNLSLGALITIGGDMNALTHWLRFLMGVEAVLGFGLLTASLSGLLSIYRALERRNSLALQLTLLHEAEMTSGLRVADLPEDIAFDLLLGLAGELASVRTDLEHYPLTYYFRARDEESALPGVLPYLGRLADEAARKNTSRAVVMAGTALGGVLDEYLKILRLHYLKDARGDRRSIFRAQAADHMREPVDLTPADHRRDLAA
jgi:hypothetical protein